MLCGFSAFLRFERQTFADVGLFWLFVLVVLVIGCHQPTSFKWVLGILSNSALNLDAFEYDPAYYKLSGQL